MSLAAAAQALNAPEALVQRSAEARAKASGASVDSILQAWAGGEAPAPTPAPAVEPEATPAPEPETATPEPAETPEPAAQPAATPEPAAGSVPVMTMPAAPTEPPVLTGRDENPFRVFAGAIGLVALMLLIGFVAPALPTEGNGVYDSAVPLTSAAQSGRDVYLREGCAACHTQQVRPIVADAGLGGVTISDSNQVLGSHRYGPDLAHVGSRVETDAELVGLLEGREGHPSYQGLSTEDLADLTAYLMQSK